MGEGGGGGGGVWCGGVGWWEQRRKEEGGLTFTLASQSEGIFRLNLYQKDSSSRGLTVSPAATHLLGTLLKISRTHSSRVSSFSEGGGEGGEGEGRAQQAEEQKLDI